MGIYVLKQRTQGYIQLMRIDKPIGTLLLLWPTLWALWIASHGDLDPVIAGIFILGTFLMRSAGCVVNDLADRKFDAYVERTQSRPLVSGIVTVKEAIMLSIVLVLLSALLLLPLNLLVWQLAIPALFIGISYPFTKRFFPMPQAYLGLAFSFGIPMAFAAQTSAVPAVAWALVLINGCWIIAYDTIYAICDKPDDLTIGIHTSAVTLGRFDVTGVMLFHTLFLAGMLMVGQYLSLTFPYYISLIIAALLIVKQYFDIRNRDRERCFKAFLDNNRVGAIIWLGLVIHYMLV